MNFNSDNITKNCLVATDPGSLGGSWENYTNYSQVSYHICMFCICVCICICDNDTNYVQMSCQSLCVAFFHNLTSILISVA